MSAFAGVLPAFQGYNDYGTPDGFYKQARRSMIDQQNRNEMQANLQAIADFQAMQATFNATVTADRAKFWELYPDKSGFEDARKKFYADLLDKDMYYLSQPENARTAGRLGDLALDNGIPQSAINLFDIWSEAIQKKEFPESQNPFESLLQMLQSPAVAEDAMKQSQAYYDAYVIDRDWAEFDAVHRNPAGCENIDFYGAMLCQRWEQRTAEDGFRQYNEMKQALGADALTAALTAVRDLPKNSAGTIDNLDALDLYWPNGDVDYLDDGRKAPPPVAPPPGKFPSLYDPLNVVIALATMHDPRLRVIASFAQDSDALREEREAYKNEFGFYAAFQYDWKDGLQTYNEWVAAMGTDAAQRALESIRTAPYTAWGKLLIGPLPVEGVSPDYAFTNALFNDKDQKLLTRLVLAQTYQLVTPAAVDEKYNQLVATYTEPGLLTAGQTFWANRGERRSSTDHVFLEALLDKKVKFDAGGKIDSTIDNPIYLTWAKVPPGTKVIAYKAEWYTWNPGPGDLHTPYWSMSRTLDNVTPDHVSLKTLEMSYPVKPNQVSRPGLDTVKARIDPPYIPPAIHEGDEMVPIGTAKIRCHWVSTAYWGKNPDGSDGEVTTWTSDLVPGHVVRIYSHSHAGPQENPTDSDWAVYSVDPVPASFSAPDSGGPLTPSGLVDLLPPFPNGALPPTPPDYVAPPPVVHTPALHLSPPPPHPPAPSPAYSPPPNTVTPPPAEAPAPIPNQSTAPLRELGRLTGKTTGSAELDDRIVADFNSPPYKALPLNILLRVKGAMKALLGAPDPHHPGTVTQLNPKVVELLVKLCHILETGKP